MREGDWCEGRRGYKQFVEKQSYSPSAWRDNLLPLLAQSSAGFPLSAQAQPPLPLTQPLVLRLSKPLFTYCDRRMLKFSIFVTVQDGKLHKCSDKDQMNCSACSTLLLETLCIHVLNNWITLFFPYMQCWVGAVKALNNFFLKIFCKLVVLVFSLMLCVQ